MTTEKAIEKLTADARQREIAALIAEYNTTDRAQVGRLRQILTYLRNERTSHRYVMSGASMILGSDSWELPERLFMAKIEALARPITYIELGAPATHPPQAEAQPDPVTLPAPRPDEMSRRDRRFLRDNDRPELRKS